MGIENAATRAKKAEKLRSCTQSGKGTLMAKEKVGGVREIYLSGLQSQQFKGFWKRNIAEGD